MKFDDAKSLACLLYISEDLKSNSCFSIETYVYCINNNRIFIISTLGTILIFSGLIGFLFLNLTRTRTFFTIGTSVGCFCGFLTFVAACMYDAGIKTTIDHYGGLNFYTERFSDQLDTSLVNIGKNASWFTAFVWFVYAVIECYQGLSFQSKSEYDVVIENR